MSNAEHAACPFCVSEGMTYVYEKSRLCFVVTCNLCDAEGPEAGTEEQAVTFWNRRPNNAPSLLEALQEAREGLDFDCTRFPEMEERLIFWANKIAGPLGSEGFHPDPVILSEICADIAKSVLPKIDRAIAQALGGTHD